MIIALASSYETARESRVVVIVILLAILAVLVMIVRTRWRVCVLSRPSMPAPDPVPMLACEWPQFGGRTTCGMTDVVRDRSMNGVRLCSHHHQYVLGRFGFYGRMPWGKPTDPVEILRRRIVGATSEGAPR